MVVLVVGVYLYSIKQTSSMKNYIIKGRGLNYKRQVVEQFVGELVKGGCSIVYSIEQAKRFSLWDAIAAFGERHALNNFAIIDAPENDDVQADEFEEYELMHEAVHVNGGYDPAQDIDSKYYGYRESIGSPSFSIQYEAGRNEVERLLKAGQREQAKALCMRLTQWNIEHNVATVTTPVRTLDQVLSA